MDDLTRHRLRELIATYSQGLCGEPKRLEALLKDYCPEHRRDINLLVNAVKDRVPADIAAASPDLRYAMQRPRLVQRLIDTQGIAADFACWTVDTWAFALGHVSETELREWDARPHIETQGHGPAATPTGAPPPLEELRQAIREALADDTVTEGEKQALKELSRRLSIPAAVANRVLAEVVAERKMRQP